MKLLIPVLFACSLLIQTPALLAEDADSSAGIGPATVTEAINVGNYIYLHLEEPDIWIATSPLEVAVGDRISFRGGAEMRNFYSKILDRTFASILFVQTISVEQRDIAKLHQGAMRSPGTDHPLVAMPNAATAPAAGEIEPLEGGMTVAAILADPAALDGQTVRLRARVIKVSENIVGRNWITLQDGSGAAPDDKLMATSAELPSTGDLVVVSGTLRKDIDIGSGYTYEVLLEEAAFSQ